MSKDGLGGMCKDCDGKIKCYEKSDNQLIYEMLGRYGFARLVQIAKEIEEEHYAKPKQTESEPYEPINPFGCMPNCT